MKKAKISGHICGKCGNDTFTRMDKGNNKGLYCTACGQWHTWMNKNLLNLYEMYAEG